MKDEEFQTFRKAITDMCSHAVSTRERWSLAEQALFHYPPILDINPDLPMNTVKQFMTCKCHYSRLLNSCHTE